jgi:hypothetical protein
VSLFWILILSISPLRHSHYQIFLGTHQVLIFLFLIGAWSHCHIDQLPYEIYINIAIAIWAFERSHRIFNIYRKNGRLGRGFSVNVAEVRAVGGGEDAVHVSVIMKKGWEYKPGQHVRFFNSLFLFGKPNANAITIICL